MGQRALDTATAEAAQAAQAAQQDSRAPLVLFVNREAMLGGMERVILLSMQQARARGYRVLFACPAIGPLADAARGLGFEIAPCEFSWLQSTLNPLRLLKYARLVGRESRRLERLCRERGVDILHPHGPVSALYAVRAAKRLKIPLIVHMHDAQPPKRLYRLASRYVAGAARCFVCVSRAVQRNVEGMGLSGVPAPVIYNGIDPVFLGEAPEPSPEVQGSGPHIGMFGQIVPWKGHHVFLEAAARIAERNPAARFYIVGTLAHPDEKPYLERLEQMADVPGLKGRVTFTGFRPDVPRWMAAMDVVVHASVEPEAFGLVIAEAMALRKRVVATDVGGPAEIIEDGVTGRLVAPDDPEAMAGAVLELMGRMDDLMEERAQAAVRARFTPERYGEELCRLYAQVMGRAPRPIPTGRTDG